MVPSRSALSTTGFTAPSRGSILVCALVSSVACGSAPSPQPVDPLSVPPALTAAEPPRGVDERPPEARIREDYGTGTWRSSPDGRWSSVAVGAGIDVWDVQASPPRLAWHVGWGAGDATFVSHARLVVQDDHPRALHVLRLEAGADEGAVVTVDEVDQWALAGGRLVVAADDIVTEYGWPSLLQRRSIHLDRRIEDGVGAPEHRTMPTGDLVLIGDALVDLEKQTIVHQGGLPALAPDAKSFALCTGKELQIIDTGSLSVGLRLDVSGTEICRTSWPNFSRDGSVLLGVSEARGDPLLVGIHCRTGAIYSQTMEPSSVEREDDTTVTFEEGEPSPVCIHRGNPWGEVECPFALDATGHLRPRATRTDMPVRVYRGARILAGKLGLTDSAVVDVTTSRALSTEPERTYP